MCIFMHCTGFKLSCLIFSLFYSCLPLLLSAKRSAWIENPLCQPLALRSCAFLISSETADLRRRPRDAVFKTTSLYNCGTDSVGWNNTVFYFFPPFFSILFKAKRNCPKMPMHCEKIFLHQWYFASWNRRLPHSWACILCFEWFAESTPV